jgi:hypothetical protein
MILMPIGRGARQHAAISTWAIPVPPDNPITGEDTGTCLEDGGTALPAHRDAGARAVGLDANVVGKADDHGQAEAAVVRRVGACRQAVARRQAVLRLWHRIGHHNLKLLTIIGERYPDGHLGAVPLVCLDRPGTCLANREAYLVKQGLGDAATTRDRGGDEPGGAHVHGQRREGDFDGSHWAARSLLLGLPGGDRLVHRLVDPEDLGEARDTEDLEDALLRADEVE